MKILVTGAWGDAQKYIDQIEAHGHHVLFMQQEKDELPCDPSEIEGVICNGLFLYHDINEFINLQYIQLTSAGYDRVPMDIVRQRGIEIHNARGVYSVPMAEHAVMGILELYRKAYLYHDYQNNKVWKKERDLLEINGKKVLIIGCGSVGTECAKRLKSFGAYVIGIDVIPQASDYYDEQHELKDLDDIIKIADIIILTVPLTSETVRMINGERLANLKKSAVIISLSRGKVVDESALAQCLKEHLILGAVLDVFEDEPLPKDSVLWSLDNIIITPHVSFIGDMNGVRLWKCISDNIL